MTFLQPSLLWLLPLVAAPVIIHLLNRMRYRSVAWAAMEFLFRATRQSTRQAKLRHWLILLCRTLAVLAIILALARPLVGGWLGWAFSGAPETVILLLDRSASMEQPAGQSPTTKRARAVERLVEAAAQLGGASRLVLIDSGTREPQEISSPSVLTEVSLTAATDAAADIPALLDAAVEYVIANQCGRTEFWLASDWQASNWAPGGARWSALADRIGALPQHLRTGVRLLGLTEPAGDNLGVTVPALARQKSGGTAALELTIEISHNRPTKMTFPLAVIVDGHRSVVNVTLEGSPRSERGGQLRLQHRVSLGDKTTGGWGWVELPPDANPRDNRAYFAYHPETHLRALVVSDDRKLAPLGAGLARRLQVATVPAPAQMNQSADMVAPAELPGVKWDDVALVVWVGRSDQIGDPTLNQFVESGGVVVSFPDGTEFESAPADAPFRVTTWRRDDGPLARTQDGQDLAVADLGMSRRSVAFEHYINSQRSLKNYVTAGEGLAVASFADGRPFLVRWPCGGGAVYWCATVPAREWSNLGEGPVLVPLLQRLMQEGGRRLGQVPEVYCGEEIAAAAGEKWRRIAPEDPVATGMSRTPLEAGVYQLGSRTVPVNRPPAEDAPEMLDETQVRSLFGTVPVRLFEEMAGQSGRLQSEVWRLVLIAALWFLLGEGWLTRQASGRETSRSGGVRPDRLVGGAQPEGAGDSRATRAEAAEPLEVER